MEATDPRDKLYALLGVDDVRDITVVPDYNHSESKIFTDFTVSYIEIKSSLEILGEAGIGLAEQTSRRFPSWVPDPQQLRMKGQNLSGNSASGSHKPAFRIDTTKSLLSVRGFVCDIISEYIEPEPETDFSLKLEQWPKLALNSPHAHPTGLPKVQALFRTITADKSGYGFGRPQFKNELELKKNADMAIGFMNAMGMISLGNIPQNMIQSGRYQRWKHNVHGNTAYAVHLTVFLELIPDGLVIMTDRELLKPFLESTNPYGELQWPYDSRNIPQEDENRLTYRFLEHTIDATKRKSFFITDKGYMGLGPARIQHGDKVCIIFGCSNPLLLRKTGDTYVLVGEIYVYGMMRGEMIEEFEAGRLAEEEFTIA